MKTAESVSPMHPDKICDRISDAILDRCLAYDPDSRVAIETMGGHGIITITGELTTTATPDIREIAKSIVGDKYGIQVNVVKQSPEIAQGVDTGGAGDQGIMIGYATNETPELLPLEVVLARNLNRHIYAVAPYDGKTQVTTDDNGKVTTIVASFQNCPKDILTGLVNEWIGKQHHAEVRDDVELHINPAGDWNIGGFEADTGLTGRKLAVDNYGPAIPIGGGAFSGKDPSKVDRSAAYMARFLAVTQIKHVEGAKEALVRLAYAIGYDKPVEATAIVTHEDGRVATINLLDSNIWDLSPNGIIERFALRRPIYGVTAEYGHFGNGFDWEV
jgi:S-adenosylmethionine synthetase